MADEPTRTARCANCGEAVGEGQGICTNCGAGWVAIWPPAVIAEPPEAGPARTSLLTGRAWLDEGLGWALACVIFNGLGNLFVFIYQMYSYHLTSPNFTPTDWRDVLLWLLYGAVFTTATGGVYLLLRRLFPNMGRNFGRGLLVLAGLAFAVILWLKLFP